MIMGMRKYDQSEKVERQSQQSPPVYKNSYGDCMVSVWESVSNGVYNVKAKFQRVYIDGKGKKNFTDSFEVEHIEDLVKLCAIVKADMEKAIMEETGGNKVSDIDNDILNHM